MVKLRHFLPWLVVLCLAFLLLPISIASAVVPVTVSIAAPAEVNPGSSFVADVTVDYVTDFDSCGFDVTYDKTVITVTDVTGGVIAGHTVVVGPGDWGYIPAGPDSGRVRVATGVAGAPAPGITGTGYIAQIHFNVVGSSCNTSAIHLEGVGMYNYLAVKIATTTVDDSVHVAFAPLEITTTSPLPEGKVGDAYPATTLAAIGGKPSYTWTADGLPAGLTCSAAGVISGTPTASGDFSVTATVTDSYSPPGIVSKVLSLKVYPALGITTTSPLPEGKVGVAYPATTLVATGGKPSLTWTATGLPAGLTCSAAGVISGTPTASGDFSVNATVTDSFSPANVASKLLSLKVYAALAITTTSPLPEGKVGVAYPATTLVATGGKTPLSWTATGLPTGLTCSAAGVISGTPTASGDFSVNATVTDSFSTPGSISKLLSLKVYAALAITTTSPLPDGKVGVAYPATTLVATGGKTPLSWTATGLPTGLTCSAAGVISGTPTSGGQLTVNATVTDSFSPPGTVWKTLDLFVCILGDANGDGVVDTGDITKVKRIYFGLDAPTGCADVNGDGKIDTGDITAIRLIYFGVD